MNYLTDGITTIDLNYVLWTNRKQSPAVPGSEHKTLGGVVIKQRLGGAVTPAITLEARLENNKLYGWFTWSDVEVLNQWRDAGTDLSFVYDGEEYAVSIPIDGVALSPLWPMRNPPANARCIGTLNLL